MVQEQGLVISEFGELWAPRNKEGQTRGGRCGYRMKEMWRFCRCAATGEVGGEVATGGDDK